MANVSVCLYINVYVPLVILDLLNPKLSNDRTLPFENMGLVFQCSKGNWKSGLMRVLS